MKKLCMIVLFLALPTLASGQGIRVGDSYPITSSLTTPGQVSTVSNAIISICNFPANAVPCTNKATTYSSVTLATPCPTSTQITLAGTNTCVGTTDARGNWGSWLPPGNYDFTVQVSTGQSFGPFTISAGNSSATANSLFGPGAIIGTFSGAATLTGPVQVTNPCNIDGQIYVTTAGCYTTVQAAMTAANAAGGGTVLVPDGTYVGPTTWYNGVILQALHPSRPDLCIESLGAGCPSPGTAVSNVKLTYTAALTISDVTKMGIVGITLDFAGSSSGNLTLAGVAQSNFDMTVDHCVITAACIIFTGSLTNNANKNTFPYLGVAGGNQGLFFGPSGSGHSFTVNEFGLVIVAELAAPAGTFTAVNFNSVCDTNHFSQIGFYTNQAAANGVIFNSASTTADTDANSEVIEFFWSTAGNITSGTGLTFNPSSGNYIKTGVMNWNNAAPCATDSVYCIATGGPTNSPNFTWITADATASRTVAIYSSQLNAQGGGTNGIPAVNWLLNNTLEWTAIHSLSQWILHDDVNNLNPLVINQGAPNNTLILNADGTLNLGIKTFSTLGTPANGRFVFCSDCTIAATCAGSGTGAFAKRLNGVWVCN